MSTHLLDRLIRDGHIVTSGRNQIPSQHEVMPLGMGAEAFPSSIGVGVEQERKGRKVQRVCCLALCGIHLGPLRYLSSSTLVGPYLQVCLCFWGVLGVAFRTRTHYSSIFILVFRINGRKRAVRVPEYGECGVKGVRGGAAKCS